MRDNVLEVLGIAGKEDVISNLLAYCIEQSASFRNIFLERICGLDAATYSDCQVSTRLRVVGAGVPDLVIVCRGRSTDWAIIENKLKAEEGADQTERYADPKVVDELTKKLKKRGLDTSAGPPRFVFLTLFPDQVPKSERFTRACYLSLVQSRPHLDQDETLAHQLASAWLSLLEDFYACEQLDPLEILADKLSSMHVLDAGYLAFRSQIHSLSLPTGLAVDRVFRSSQQGRKYYGTVIAKPEWKVGRFDDSGSRWTLSEDNRYIHIEPQYDVLSEALKMYIHYETNPYYRKRTLEERVVPDQYEAYIARREAFIRHFADVDTGLFRMRVGLNQIAKAEVSLSGSTVKEVQQSMQNLIATATEAVDQALAAEQPA